jgi:hypothetical protein
MAKRRRCPTLSNDEQTIVGNAAEGSASGASADLVMLGQRGRCGQHVA